MTAALKYESGVIFLPLSKSRFPECSRVTASASFFSASFPRFINSSISGAVNFGFFNPSSTERTTSSTPFNNSFVSGLVIPFDNRKYCPRFFESFSNFSFSVFDSFFPEDTDWFLSVGEVLSSEVAFSSVSFFDSLSEWASFSFSTSVFSETAPSFVLAFKSSAFDFSSFIFFNDWIEVRTNSTCVFTSSWDASWESSSFSAFSATLSWFSTLSLSSVENSPNKNFNSCKDLLSLSLETGVFLLSSVFSTTFSPLSLGWVTPSFEVNPAATFGLSCKVVASTCTRFCSEAWAVGPPIKNIVVPIRTLAAPKWYLRIENRCFNPYQLNDFLFFLFIKSPSLYLLFTKKVLI